MEKILLNIHVASLAEVKGDLTKIISGENGNLGGFGKLYLDKEYEHLKVKIDYPLEVPYELVIPKAICVADIVCAVADAYKNVIYSSDEETNPFGIWGHNIEDLWFERIDILDDNTVELFIGS